MDHLTGFPATKQPRPERTLTLLLQCYPVTATSETPNKVETLISAVDKIHFRDYPVEKLNDVFLSVNKFMEYIMLAKGYNGNKVQPMAKERLRRKNTLPETVG